MALLEKLVENVSLHTVSIYSYILTKAVYYVARNGTIYSAECVIVSPHHSIF
jgi:hypothetical protein